MSLLSNILSMATPVIVDRIAAALGVNNTLVRTAINLALPAILGAFASKAATPAGASALFNAANATDPNLMGSLDSMLAGAGKDQVINSGNAVLGNLLGNSTVSSLVNSIGSKAGLSDGAAAALVPMLGQMALSGLANSGAKDASGLANMLKSEAASFTSAAPRMATPTAPVAEAPGGMGLLKWLIPLVALAALGWWMFGHKDADDKAGMQPAATTTAPATTPAAAGLTVDGVDVGKSLTDAIGGLSTTLGTVTDAATAQTALPKVQDAAKAVDTAAAAAAKFSAEQKSAAATLVSAALPALKAASEKALAAQGVGDVLKPVLDGIFAKLDAMTK